MKMMTKMLSAIVVTAVILTGGATTALAQQTEKAPEPPKIPLKVTVTVSRFDGDKKTASLPFVLWVNAGDRNGSSIQMGTEVPVPSTSLTDGKVVQSYTLRSLGTNITCDATAMADGLYRLALSVQDSQVFRQSPANPSGLASFQSFRSTNAPILKDGQTVQFAVATDKTSGEVIKIDVTLNVVK